MRNIKTSNNKIIRNKIIKNVNKCRKKLHIMKFTKI